MIYQWMVRIITVCYIVEHDFNDYWILLFWVLEKGWIKSSVLFSHGPTCNKTVMVPDSCRAYGSKREHNKRCVIEDTFRIEWFLFLLILVQIAVLCTLLDIREWTQYKRIVGKDKNLFAFAAKQAINVQWYLCCGESFIRGGKLKTLRKY